MLKLALKGLSEAGPGTSTRGASSASNSFASDSAIQLALLSCACELVAFLLVDPQKPFPAACQRMASGQYMLEMWEAVHLFMKHLTPTMATTSASQGLPCRAATLPPGRDQAPAAALNYLAFIRMRLLDELALAPGSTVFDAMLSDPEKHGKLHAQVWQLLWCVWLWCMVL